MILPKVFTCTRSSQSFSHLETSWCISRNSLGRPHLRWSLELKRLERKLQAQHLTWKLECLRSSSREGSEWWFWHLRSSQLCKHSGDSHFHLGSRGLRSSFAGTPSCQLSFSRVLTRRVLGERWAHLGRGKCGSSWTCSGSQEGQVSASLAYLCIWRSAKSTFWLAFCGLCCKGTQRKGLDGIAFSN